MAIRLRCPKCEKRVSIDEAFAGGVCRCPYCKALVKVSSHLAQSAGPTARPSAPASRAESPGGRPSVPPPEGRPAAPSLKSAQSSGQAAPQAAFAQGAASVSAEDEIPVASPVKVQGIIALIVLGLVVVTAAGVGLVLAKYGKKIVSDVKPPVKESSQPAGQSRQQDGGAIPGAASSGGDAGVQADDDAAQGPRIGSLAVASPVAYCIGSGSGGMLDRAIGATLESLETLNAGDKFTILLAEASNISTMPGGWASADAAGRAKADEFGRGIFSSSSSGLAAAVVVASGMNPIPRTIIIILADPLSDADIAKAVQAADAAGARLSVFSLTDEKGVLESVKKLVGTKSKGAWKVGR